MKLSERVERADGPSRELDAEIAVAVRDISSPYTFADGVEVFYRTSGDGLRAEMWTRLNGQDQCQASRSPDAYTASLDAAMMLARNDAEAFSILSDAMIQLEEDGWQKGAWAKTLPRYICAAALRARGL